MTINNNYAVILAGGKGKRLWPHSREEFPKQFIDFFGDGQTLLQHTFEHLVKQIPTDQIFVTTNKAYKHIVQEQLPELPEENILAEPVGRNTAPSLVWATHRIIGLNPDANVIVMPSDLTIQKESIFQENMKEGFEFVNNQEVLLVLGIKPTRPEPGFGYIQFGRSQSHNVFSVTAFTEKPEREFAKMFVKSKEWYWNTGIFIAGAKYLKQNVENFISPIFQELDNRKQNWTTEDEQQIVDQLYPSFPNLSLNTVILEKSENVYVMKCDFGWADMGTWHSIYEYNKKSKSDNVIIASDVMIDDSTDNIIKLPKGRLGVISGLNGFIVAEKDNVLLICRKGDSSSLIRKYVNEVQINKGKDYI